VKRGPLKVFYSYAHQDEKARRRTAQSVFLMGVLGCEGYAVCMVKAN
jgi:hypothetical protein